MNRNEIALRKKRLLDAIKLSEKITTAETMTMLGISKSTATRLFIALEEEGKVIRVQNGAMLARENFEYTYDDLEYLNYNEKKQIGECASALVSSGDTVYLDSGTTLPHMCVALEKRISSGELTNVRIFIRSLVNLNILHKAPNVFCIGGIYRHAQRDFNGYISESAISQLHFDKCFLGADGLDIDGGITTVDFSSARLNSLVVSKSYEKYILADSSKFGKISSIRYSDVSDITCLVTDSRNPEYCERLSEKKIAVRCI